MKNGDEAIYMGIVGPNMNEEQRIKFNEMIKELMCPNHMSQYKDNCGLCRYWEKQEKKEKK